MTAKAFVHVLSRGMLILLALTANTLVVVQRAHGATTSTSEECSTEVDACRSDETCRDCIFTVVDSSQEISECRTALGHDEIESSTVTCSDQMEVVCCFDEAAEEECLDSDEFVDYFLCLLEVAGCTDDDITCSGAVSNLGGASNVVVVAFSCVFALFLPLLLRA